MLQGSGLQPLALLFGHLRKCKGKDPKPEVSRGLRDPDPCWVGGRAAAATPAGKVRICIAPSLAERSQKDLAEVGSDTRNYTTPVKSRSNHPRRAVP